MTSHRMRMSIGNRSATALPKPARWPAKSTEQHPRHKHNLTCDDLGEMPDCAKNMRPDDKPKSGQHKATIAVNENAGYYRK